MGNTILVPVDGSKYSLAALEVAKDLAIAFGANLVLCYVVDLAKAAAMTFGESQLVPGYFNALRDEGRAILDEAATSAKTRVPSVETKLVDGIVVDEIHSLARACDAGWIVMGSHGRTGIDRLLMGSVAEGVLRNAACPVLIVPRAKGAPKSTHGSTAAGAKAS